MKLWKSYQYNPEEHDASSVYEEMDGYTSEENHVSSFYGVSHNDWKMVKNNKLPCNQVRSMADHIGMPKPMSFHASGRNK